MPPGPRVPACARPNRNQSAVAASSSARGAAQVSQLSRRTRLGILGPAALPAFGSHMIPRPAYCLHPARPPPLDVGRRHLVRPTTFSAIRTQQSATSPPTVHRVSIHPVTLDTPRSPALPRALPGHQLHPPQLLLCNPPHRSIHFRRPIRTHSTAILIVDDAHQATRRHMCAQRGLTLTLHVARSECCPFVSRIARCIQEHISSHKAACRASPGPATDRALRPSSAGCGADEHLY